MQQFRKCRRLISLYEKKNSQLSRALLNLNSNKREVIEKIKRCEKELEALNASLRLLQFNNTTITKADIFNQLQKQATISSQRINVQLEQRILVENLDAINSDIKNCQRTIALIERKEMKFAKWLKLGKTDWLKQQDSVSEAEISDLLSRHAT